MWVGLFVRVDSPSGHKCVIVRSTVCFSDCEVLEVVRRDVWRKIFFDLRQIA